MFRNTATIQPQNGGIFIRVIMNFQESYEATVDNGRALPAMMVPGTIMHVDRYVRLELFFQLYLEFLMLHILCICIWW